jgi:3-hydroxyisobutyrate dehydrogenase
MAKVAFIGLGVMGYPMAGHLAKRGGHDVTVYNRTAAKAEKWVAETWRQGAPTPKAAAEGADFVFTCVGNDDDLRSVTLGPDGALRRHEEGRDLHRQHHRLGRRRARTLRRRREAKGFGFLDAPVSGGQAGAENGQLTVMVGGDEAPSTRRSR